MKDMFVNDVEFTEKINQRAGEYSKIFDKIKGISKTISSLAPVVIKSHVANQENFSVGQISGKLAVDFLIQTAISPFIVKYYMESIGLLAGICPIQHNVKLMYPKVVRGCCSWHIGV